MKKRKLSPELRERIRRNDEFSAAAHANMLQIIEENEARRRALAERRARRRGLLSFLRRAA